MNVSQTPRSSDSTVPSATLYLAVALIAAAVLGFEVALSRVFATVLRYQFAFLVVSLALCGLGLGGLLAHKRRNLSLPNLAIGWGVSSMLALALILRGVFAFVPQHYWLAALIVLVPFVCAGAFLSLVFERFSEQGGKLYAYDLAGAALAALGSVALMQWLGAINACLAFGALGALAGVLLAKNRATFGIFTALLFALVPLNSLLKVWSVQPIPPIYQVDETTKQQTSLADRGVTQPLFTELGDAKYGSKIVDSRWNAFARTDVVTDPQAPDSFLLYTNGNVPTNMLKWNGKLWTLPILARDFPLSDWVFQSAELSDKRVLSIGPGGGLDALLALQHGAKRFDGAEINPDIVSLMDEPKYRAFNGGIYRHTKVHVEVAEGRAFVREARSKNQKYQLIFSALTKTATAGQGAALLESFIYTENAFVDYLSVLEPDGQLAIVGDAPQLLARLFATGVSHFKAQNQTEAQAGRHLAVVFYPQPGPYRWALIVQKSPISPARASSMNKEALKRNLFPLWIPGQANRNDLFPFGALGSGALSLGGFVDAGMRANPTQPLDLTPAPDDRPFVLDLARSPFAIFSSSPSLSILLGLSVLGTFGFAGTLLSLGANRRDGIVSVFYFLCLGIGFMLVEIPLIQKLILPLGYPTLSLSVILFAILLGGGAGAWASQRFEGERLRVYAAICALGVVALSLLIGASSGAISNFLLPLPLVLRCALVALMLLPLGFVLGTPFPSGLRLLGAGGQAVPLIWALNGTASVVGSILAAVGAKMFGFNGTLTIGAAIYALAALILWAHGKMK